MCKKENKSPTISSLGLGNRSSAVPGKGLGHPSWCCATGRERLSFSELCMGGGGGCDGCCPATESSWRALGRSPGNGPSSIFSISLAIVCAFCRCICYFVWISSPITQNAQFLHNIQVRTSVQACPSRKGRTLFLLSEERGVSQGG